MNKFRITYTRPYLPIPERHELQYDVLLAESEQQVRDIFADCEVLNVESIEPCIVDGVSSKEWWDAQEERSL